LSFVLVVLCISCNCRFEINEYSIRSSCGFEYPFEISKIKVDSFEYGVPFLYTKDTTVICSPYCIHLSEAEFKAIYGSNKPYIDTCNFKSSKRIFFYEANSNY